MIKLETKDVPADAIAAMSEDQRSYLDEFSFYSHPGCEPYIEAHYAGEYCATWDGDQWIS